MPIKNLIFNTFKMKDGRNTMGKTLNYETTNPTVGFIGWRGMVGSVLLERMLAERNFNAINTRFFTTSQAGQPLPSNLAQLTKTQTELTDAFDVTALAECHIVVTCQGGDYTSKIYHQLRNTGWQGYFIDAASTLRQEDNTMICLEPVNAQILRQGLKEGIRTFVGSNCNTAIMLVALAGLFKENLVNWLSVNSYQAISGAGAKAMDELLAQMKNITQKNEELQNFSFLNRQLELNVQLNSASFPNATIGAPLANNLLPWIDLDLENGQSREEKKTMDETNKILKRSSSTNMQNPNHNIPIDGICVRVPTLRCHSLAFTIALKNDISETEIEKVLATDNPFVKVISNNKKDTLAQLTPAAVTGSLKVNIGRIKKTRISPTIISAFAVGDQLLWGAAEPLRCMLMMIIQEKFSKSIPVN